MRQRSTSEWSTGSRRRSCREASDCSFMQAIDLMHSVLQILSAELPDFAQFSTVSDSARPDTSPLPIEVLQDDTRVALSVLPAPRPTLAARGSAVAIALSHEVRLLGTSYYTLWARPPSLLRTRRHVARFTVQSACFTSWKQRECETPKTTPALSAAWSWRAWRP